MASLVNQPLPPCVIHEDEDLLVVNKPAGINTHSPSPLRGDGLYDWLRCRDARFENLAIMHRLDKETSGLLIFTKTTRANRSLTRQFTERSVRKRYLLVTDRHVEAGERSRTTRISRQAARYVSGQAGPDATTRFRVIGPHPLGTLIEAMPLTGRTHQIRVHAAELGWPIVGDTLYGGTQAPRLCLHAASITFQHPGSGEETHFVTPHDFATPSFLALRQALLPPAETDSFRLVHGASDGFPGWYVDQLGPFLLSQSETPLRNKQVRCLAEWQALSNLEGAFQKQLPKDLRGSTVRETSPVPLLGKDSPTTFVVRENGLSFEISFSAGHSVGLFLDQRENRQRCLHNVISPGLPILPEGLPGKTALNAFSYTCGFSVCLAAAGMSVTSIDLSRKYLEWGRRNFEHNELDLEPHSFLAGDVFDWFRRLSKKGKTFDLIILDPPTFSQSKRGGVFRTEKDYPRLVDQALAVLSKRGALLTCTNTARISPEEFSHSLRRQIQASGRSAQAEVYVAQPFDFPISREERAHFKSIWWQIR